MNAEYEKSVGNNIRKIREEANMTQDMLATKEILETTFEEIFYGVR